MTKTVTSLQLTAYRHAADDVRTYPPPTGGGGGSPIILPLYAGFFGDSNTGGRPNSTLPAKSPHDVFLSLYVANGGFPLAANRTLYSQSGGSLQGSASYLAGRSFAGRPWILIEESGSQDDAGQRTPLEFGDTFEATWRTVHSRWPDGLFTAPTAPNFGRPAGMRWREWKTTSQWADWGYPNEGAAISYNDELLRRIDILAADGITVIPIMLADREDELAAVIDGGAATLYSDTDPFHWSPIGRLLQALETFRCLGYDVATLDLSGETVHTNPATDAAYKADAVAVVAAAGA